MELNIKAPLSGIKLADAVAARDAAVAEIAESYPNLIVRVEGPHFDHTEEISSTETVSISVKEIEYEGEQWFALMTADGDNLSAGPYDEWGYFTSSERAIKEAVDNHGDSINVAAGTFACIKVSGWDEIDGTGRLSVHVISDRHAPAGGGRFGGGWD